MITREHLSQLIPNKARRVLDQAEPILRAQVAGTLSKLEANKALNQVLGSAEEILTSPLIELENDTPLAVLRAILEGELREAQQAVELEESRSNLPHKIRLHKEKPYHLMEALKNDDTFVRFTGLEDSGFLSPATLTVHLTNQSVVKLSVIKRIVALAPNLKTIQISPAHDRLIWPSTRAYCDEYGIEIRIGRIRDAEIYDNPYAQKGDYVQEKRLFEALAANPKKSRELQLMAKFELIDYRLALDYYNDPNTSVRKLAQKYGLSFPYVTRHLMRFKYWMGVAHQSKKNSLDGKAVSRELVLLERASNQEKNFQHFREEHKAGDLYPPESLPIQRWEIWQQLQELININAEGINQLIDRHPRSWSYLCRYYQLGEYRGMMTPMTQMGVEEGVSKTTIEHRRNLALRQLGIIR